MHAITEHELARLLGGEALGNAENQDVICRGVHIGQCTESGFLEKLKCQHKRHDQEALEKYIERWSPAVQKLYLRTIENSACPVCGGEGYIGLKSREGKMLSMSALIFCRYAAIELPAQLCKELIRGVAC